MGSPWRWVLLAMILQTGWSAGADPIDEATRGLTLRNVSNRDGLSQMSVLALTQDSQGFLWIGTADGLNRFDGYEFQVYRHHPDDPDSLSNNQVRVLHSDRLGRLWIGTVGGGLNRFDADREAFVAWVHQPDRPDSLSDDTVLSIHEDTAGRLWLGTAAGVDRLDPETGAFERDARLRLVSPLAPGFGYGAQAIVGDASGTIWVASAGMGLYRLDPDGQGFEVFRHAPDDPHSLADDRVRSLMIDASGLLYVGSDGGLQRLDPRGRRFERLGDDPVTTLLADRSGNRWVGTHGRGLVRLAGVGDGELRLRHDPRDPHGLAVDDVVALFEDRAGTLWVGTNGGGLDRIDPRQGRFATVRHDPDDPTSLPNNFVRDLMEDRRGALWVATEDGLARRDPGQEGFVHFRHDPDDPASLPHDRVFTVWDDPGGDLWVGTAGGLGRLDREDRRFRVDRHDPENPDSLAGNTVRTLLRDHTGTLWVGTDRGLDRLDETPDGGRRFVHHRGGAKGSVSLGGVFIWDLLEDRHGNLWVGTWQGLHRIDPTRQTLERYRHDPSDPESLAHDRAWALLEGYDGRLWVGTDGGGLDRFDPETGTFDHFTRADGLANDTVYGLLEDGLGRLWISTNQGISRFDPTRGHWASYDVMDGLQDNEFTFASAGRGADGTLYFGGIRGFDAWRPERFHDHLEPPGLVLTGLRIFDAERALGHSAVGLERIELEHWQNFLTFEFAALGTSRPDRSRYAYRLEGVDDGWVQAGERRFANYTALSPGDYVFRLRASNGEGVWTPAGLAVALRVAPPLWRTWWAWSGYGLLAVGLVAWVWGSQRRKMGRERAINRKLRELDRLKDELLAKTSHELRTPLYGMTGIAESLIATGDAIPPQVSSQLALIAASGHRLSNLVHDILDFTRLRRDGLELRRRPTDLRSLIETVLALSRPLLVGKQIVLRTALADDLPPVDGDGERLQQVFYNLLDNAIKFTDQGTIEIRARRVEDHLRVEVADSGVGIEAKDLDSIFGAFEQASAGVERSVGGAGLGLSICRHLVELHGGRLWAESRSGEGATFLLTLPIAPEVAPESGSARRSAGPAALHGPPVAATAAEAEDREAGLARDSATHTGARILVVDDEPVNRLILIEHLSASDYRVTPAASGAEALRLVADQRPDLVLLDVMMPGLSGFEVCARLRREHGPAELPVVFLTAKEQVKDLVQGLDAGGNDYLVKPLAREEVLARVRTHLNLAAAHAEVERSLRQQRQLVAELEGRNLELAQLAHAFSHDLQNPLTTLTNFAGKIRGRGTDTGATELDHDLRRIETAATTMHRLLEDLVEFTRLGSSVEPHREIELKGLLDEVLASVAGDSAERGAQVRVADDLPSVPGDRDQLALALRHLVENALRFTVDGASPEVEIRARREGQRVTLTIADQGRGIARDYHDSIFRLFERLDPEQGGTGVGLALVRRVAEAHGGRVWVESEGVGKGSAFHLELPAAGGES